jgi:hypothetical protein
MMAVRKATRSNPPAQPNPQHAKTARAGGPEPKPKQPDRQLKAEIFETLRHLNRGYGVALAALDKLETKDSYRARRIFPAGFLGDYRNRAEGLRALTNHDVLLLIAGREQQEAERFNRLCDQAASPKRPRRS